MVPKEFPVRATDKFSNSRAANVPAPSVSSCAMDHHQVAASLLSNMSLTFIHTADWQLGKPFAGVEDIQKRALLQNERFAAITRIGDEAKRHGAAFVVIAGDLFDSPSADKATVSAACSAIGALKIPVFAIPGNHDHGGPGSLWEQEFFRREIKELAPNFKLLDQPEPHVLENAVLFPCPLVRRHESADLTAWLRTIPGIEDQFGDKPRIVIAHGTVINFGTIPDDEDFDSGTVNHLDLARLPDGAFDYIALGDWHGAKQVAANAWYPGTPELDRFVKGEGHDPGNILVVKAGRGQAPQVQSCRTAKIGWSAIEFRFGEETGLEHLKAAVNETTGTRINQDLMRLTLSGPLGIEASSRLEEMMETWRARLLRVKFANQTSIAPSQEELDGLTRRGDDPLLSRVAGKRAELSVGSDQQADLARIALRELYTACNPH